MKILIYIYIYGDFLYYLHTWANIQYFVNNYFFLLKFTKLLDFQKIGIQNKKTNKKNNNENKQYYNA